MENEQLNAVVVAVTNAVTEAVTAQMQTYVDERLDWVMNEVQSQILDFEQRVSAGLDQIAQGLSTQLVHSVNALHSEGIIAESYKRWVLSEAARLDVGIGDFAKVMAAMKKAAADGDADAGDGGE